MNNQKRILTVGQLAKICAVNKRTLHYYDEIGLFSPNLKGENGYRYYTLEQIADLELVLAFRDLGMSIEEIKASLHGNMQSLNRIMTDKLAEIDEKIHSLTNMKHLLQAKQALAALWQEGVSGQISFVHCEEEAYVLSSQIIGSSDETYYVVLSSLLQGEGRCRLFNHEYGIMLSSEKIERGVFEEYDYFYIKPRETGGRQLFYRPAGEYLRVLYKGCWEELPQAYDKIRSFAKENGYVLKGYAYERGLNETLSTNMQEYITEIIVQYDLI